MKNHIRMKRIKNGKTCIPIFLKVQRLNLRSQSTSKQSPIT